MTLLLRTLFRNPFQSLQLLVLSAFANLLAFSAPIFVILILNKYVSYGLDGTLITLTTGAFIAIAAEYSLRRLRFNIAQKCIAKGPFNFAHETFGRLINSEEGTLNGIDPYLRNEIFRSANRLDRFYTADNLSLILDLPFTILFLVAIYLINANLALITGGLALIYLLGSVLYSIKIEEIEKRAEKEGEAKRRILGSLLLDTETLSLFGIKDKLITRWRVKQKSGAETQALHLDRKNALATKVRIFNAVITIIVIAAGAQFVVGGDLTIGALIGANILAARTIFPIFSFSAFISENKKQRFDLEAVQRVRLLKQRSEGEVVLTQESFKLAMKNGAFRYRNQNNYILEDINFEIGPGQILVVRGPNGVGKTTLIKLMLGLLNPSKGVVLINNINLNQINFGWWATNISYLPQEPTFYDGSIHENFLAHNPNFSMERTRDCLLAAGLRQLCEETNNGLLSNIKNDGLLLSIGVRRRLALARALIYEGQALILDEPTENLDTEGRQIVYRLLNKSITENKTIICVTQDPEIIKGGNKILDLDFDNIPRLINVE